MKQDVFKRYLYFDGPTIVAPTKGKRFEIFAIRHSRAAADKIATSVGRKGFYTRAVPLIHVDTEDGIWGIYKRKAD